MRVVGIDCGTERTGYGIIESDGGDHRIIASGVIRTRANWPLSVGLLEISRELREVIRCYTPAAADVEDVFTAVNARSALKLAHVRGIALLAVAEAGLECGEYSPLEVKTSVVGYGRAEKSQVQMMVRSLLNLNAELPSEDACDALAVAICHVTRREMHR